MINLIIELESLIKIERKYPFLLCGVQILWSALPVFSSMLVSLYLPRLAGFSLLIPICAQKRYSVFP
jgi:hypothetical protein